jgi:hypothetical protein
MQRPQKVIKPPKQRIPFSKYLSRLPLRDPKTVQFLIHSYYVLQETGEFVYRRQNVDLVHDGLDDDVQTYYLNLIRRFFAFSNPELDQFIEFLQNKNVCIYDYYT